VLYCCWGDGPGEQNLEALTGQRLVELVVEASGDSDLHSAINFFEAPLVCRIPVEETKNRWRWSVVNMQEDRRDDTSRDCY
jgi:hypothetical protein